MPSVAKNKHTEQSEAPYQYLHERLTDEKAIPQELQADMAAYCHIILPIREHGQNRKHLPKLQKFAEDHPQLVTYLVQVCRSLEYPLFESGEVIFYTLATLALSGQAEAISYLDWLIDLCIVEEHGMLAMLREITSAAFPGKEHGFSSKLETYYDRLCKESEFFPFTQMVGLDISACTGDKAPDYGFTLSTIEGARYKFEIEPEQEKSFYILDVRVYLPYGTEQCFTIKLTAPNDTVKLEQLYKEAHMSDRTYLYIYDYRTKAKTIIENGCSLLHLKETICKIEEVLGVTFQRDFVDSSFARGIKNKKALQAWMLN